MDVQYYFKLSLHHLFILIINAKPTYLTLASENGEISVTEMSIYTLCAILHASVPFFFSPSKQCKLGGGWGECLFLTDNFLAWLNIFFWQTWIHYRRFQYIMPENAFWKYVFYLHSYFILAFSDCQISRENERKSQTLWCHKSNHQKASKNAEIFWA